MRVRLALHSGPVDAGENGATSTPVIVACRLVDADPVRTAQRESTELVTIVVSEKFFTDTLQHEPAAEPELYQQVTISVKELHTTAWIRTTAAQPRQPLVMPPPSTTFTTQSSHVHDLAVMLMTERSLYDEAARIHLLGLLPAPMVFGVRHDVDPWSFAKSLALACLRHEHGGFHLAEALKALEINLNQIHDQSPAAPREIPQTGTPFDSHLGLVPQSHREPSDPPPTEPPPPDVFPPAQRTELLTMLANVVIPDIVDLYRRSGDRDAPDLGKHTTYPRILDALGELNSRADGIPRTLVFVEYLAARVDPDLKIRLRRWTSARAAEMDVGEELTAVREEVLQSLVPTPPAEPVKQVAYLVVQLERIGPSGDDFLVKSWRQLGNSAQWAPERQDDLAGSLEKTKNHVAQLIENAEIDWNRQEPDIVVHFVLDTPDLALDVDQWPWENDVYSEPIGTRYVAVVRSAERMRSRKYHREWWSRWEGLTRQLSRTGRVDPACNVTAFGNDEHDVRKLMAELRTRPDVVSVVLSEPPRPECAGRDELSIAVKAGVPLILVHRQHPAAEFAAAIKEILHDAGDGDHVLDRVRSARIAGFAKAPEDEHIGTALTVLFDDPNRPIVPQQPGHPIEEGAVG